MSLGRLSEITNLKWHTVWHIKCSLLSTIFIITKLSWLLHEDIYSDIFLGKGKKEVYFLNASEILIMLSCVGE